MKRWALRKFTRRQCLLRLGNLMCGAYQKRVSSPRKRGTRQLAAMPLIPIERAIKIKLFGIPRVASVAGFPLTRE
jgi:hypothetical protein